MVGVYVDLVSSTPPEAADVPDPVAPPELGEGPHLSYAVQWFVFTVCAVVGWVLAVRASVNRRRRVLESGARPDASGDLTVAAGGAAPVDPPSSGADERATAPR